MQIARWQSLEVSLRGVCVCGLRLDGCERGQAWGIRRGHRVVYVDHVYGTMGTVGCSSDQMSVWIGVRGSDEIAGIADYVGIGCGRIEQGASPHFTLVKSG